MGAVIKTCGKFQVPIQGKRSLQKLLRSLGGDIEENKHGNHRFKAVYEDQTCPLGKTTDYQRHFIPWLKEAIGKDNYNKDYVMETLRVAYA